MCVVSPQTIVQRNELPKFNGKSIKSIYAVYENSRHSNKAYIADILYYRVSYYGEKWHKRYEMMIRELPKDFQPFLGKVLIHKEKSIFVKSLYFRESDSHNGGFTDESLSLDGWSVGGQSDGFNLYRGVPAMDKYSCTISTTCKLGKQVLKIIGKSYKVKEIEFWECDYKMKEGSLDFATKFPYEYWPIRIIDGLVYPDEKLPSWRWLHGMPYRQPEGQTNRINIRVWDEVFEKHLYLEKVEECEVGEELLTVNFGYNSHDIYPSEGDAYCKIRRYNEVKGHEFLKHTVTKKNDLDCKGLYRIINIR